jgi:starch-binding outer membrane protein SusE/F
MKKLLTGLLTFSSIGLLMLASCKKSDKMVTDAGSTSSTLSVSTTSPVLNTAMINDTSTIIKFTFTSPKYTYKGAGQQNEIQVDAAGDNWKNPAATVLTSNSEGFTTFALAKLLIGLQLPAGKQTTVNVRVANQMSAESALYSNVITLTVTPINLASWIYIVGQFQGWSTSSADSLISASSNGIYTGVIDFPPSSPGQNGFLILPTRSFNTKYATAGGPDTATTSSTYPTQFVTGGDNNFFVKTQGGYYILTLNTNTNILTIVPADSYSLIGSATPGTAWSTDTQMKFINDGKDNWVANNIPMIVGEYKFRLDDAWNTSWGPSATAGTVVTSGAVGDGNIQLTSAGNYDFTLYEAPTTLGSTSPAPLATTTFTAVKQ